ncbi:MAG: tRNA lysidine(34) synthetase TilS [Chloracidobacterium sp.]|nr:tRNA lysidine(34) synthetase TilS [Chloracidobacterium sp.]
MHSFVRNLITEWRRLDLPFEGGTIVVAVSGGADSVSLLLAIHDLTQRKKLGHRIVAAHFDHGLRGAESDADAEFVRDLTTNLGVELSIKRGKVSMKGNLEQNARDERYVFLTETAKNLDAFAVLTGHTINDQAETFLLNLIRGSGVAGLAGMRTVRPLGVEEWRSGGVGESEDAPLLPPSSTPPLLIRPLLTWAKRADTEAFCHAMNIVYRRDSMNDDTLYKRVQIRKVLLPMLADMNPNIVETLANTAALMQASVENSKDSNQIEPPDELILSEVKDLPVSEVNLLIRAWLKRHRGTTRALQLKHIDAVSRLILSTKSGRAAELPGGGRVVKSAGKLVYEEN